MLYAVAGLLMSVSPRLVAPGASPPPQQTGAATAPRPANPEFAGPLGIAALELFVLGVSIYAAFPEYYGNKVVGGLWGASALVAPMAQASFGARRDWGFVVGLALGYAALALFNFVAPENTGRLVRFGVNFGGAHAAVGMAALGALLF